MSMRKSHITPVSKTPAPVQTSILQLKLDTKTRLIDRLLLLQLQAPWKILPIPDGGGGGTSGS